MRKFNIKNALKKKTKKLHIENQVLPTFPIQIFIFVFILFSKLINLRHNEIGRIAKKILLRKLIHYVKK